MTKIKIKQTDSIQPYTKSIPEIKVIEKEYVCDKYEIHRKHGKLFNKKELDFLINLSGTHVNEDSRYFGPILINIEKAGDVEICVSSIVCDPLIDTNYKLFEFIDNEWVLVDEYNMYN